MLMFRAAFAAAVVVSGAQARVHAAESLSLDDTFVRVIETHPDLAVLRHSQDALAAGVDLAAQRPTFTFGASVENVLGTGAASGVNGAELTLSLASVLERGDKRAARVALAQRQLDAVELRRDGKRLDLLAEVARRYLDAASAQAIEGVTRDDLAQRETIVAAAAKRVAAGGAPESVQLAAEAARLRVVASLEQAQRQQQIAKRRLAVLWGGADADFDLAALDVARLPPLPAYRDLVQRLAETPELRRFADETRLREARLQLARSATKPDLEWQVGVRRMQNESDWGLVGSVAIPLGSARRAEPGIRAAEAELAAIALEREGEQRVLQATLAEAWGQLDLAIATARRIDDALLPQLQRAEAAAERAYRAGALGYLEWAQLQTDTTAARRERLDASLAAHRALIELQRLTGETFRVSGDASTEATP